MRFADKGRERILPYEILFFVGGEKGFFDLTVHREQNVPRRTFVRPRLIALALFLIIRQIIRLQRIRCGKKDRRIGCAREGERSVQRTLHFVLLASKQVFSAIDTVT